MEEMNTGILLNQKTIDVDSRIEIAIKCIKNNPSIVQKLNSLCFIIYRLLEKEVDVFNFLKDNEIDFFNVSKLCFELNEFDKHRWNLSLHAAYFYSYPLNTKSFVDNSKEIIDNYPYCLINLLRIRFLFCIIGISNQEDVSDVIYKSIEDFKYCVSKINFEINPDCRIQELSTATNIIKMLILLLPYFSKGSSKNIYSLIDIISLGESIFFINASKKILNIS